LNLPSQEVTRMFQLSFVGVSEKGALLYLGDQDCVSRKYRKSVEKCLRKDGKLTEEEEITGVLEEHWEGQSMAQVIRKMEDGALEVELDREQYQRLKPYLVEVNAKYKTMEKKVRPAAVPLPVTARKMLKMARAEPCLRD
jgi:hypothetical protein